MDFGDHIKGAAWGIKAGFETLLAAHRENNLFPEHLVTAPSPMIPLGGYLEQSIPEAPIPIWDLEIWPSYPEDDERTDYGEDDGLEICGL